MSRSGSFEKVFLNALYDEEDNTELGSDEDSEGSDEEDRHADVSWPPSTYFANDNARPPERGSPQLDRPSLLPESPATEHESSPLRDRSRSPIWPGAYPVIELREEPAAIRLYDEDGNAINSVEGEFLAPDQHSLFEVRGYRLPAEDRASSNRARSGRRRGRSIRGMGSRRRAAGRRRGASGSWKSGDPLTQIYLTDDDIPADLMESVESVIRQRESKMAERKSGAREDDSGEEDFFEDAEAGEEIFVAADSKFEWSPMDSFRPTEEQFKPEHTGSTESHTSPYSAFRSYWDDLVLQHIVWETNAYASTISSSSFQSEWVPTNLHEILVLFSFWMMLGIVRMPTVKSCFSTNPLLETTVFRRMFTRKRYDALVRALHFFETVPNNPEYRVDPLYRIRPILTHLNAKFQANYTLSKNICIDESLILWKGRLSIRQYIRTKAAKWGIKVFELCESVTGYLWSFVVYSGKHTSLDTGRYSGLQKSTGMVLTLVEPLLNKGYRLFMDSWYNSPLLSRYLKRNGTDSVGTLRPDRQHVPPLLNLCKLKPGQVVGRHSGDVCVMAWQDKKKVTMISTCHGLDQGLNTVSSATSKTLYKPQAVLDYNKYMGGVDLKDQMLEPFLLERKRCSKWYMKLFKHLLNCSIQNSRILLQSSTGRHQDNLDFRLRLVDALLAIHLSQCPVSRRQLQNRNNLPTSSRMPQPTHWPIRVPQTPRDAEKGRQSRKQCFWCTRNGRKIQKTPYNCEQCNVPLCIEICFKAYHLASS